MSDSRQVVRTVAEDGGDREATRALDVHEEASGAWHKGLDIVSVTLLVMCVQARLLEVESANTEDAAARRMIENAETPAGIDAEDVPEISHRTPKSQDSALACPATPASPLNMVKNRP